jgi:hypothetical protein
MISHVDLHVCINNLCNALTPTEKHAQQLRLLDLALASWQTGMPAISVLFAILPSSLRAGV